VRFRAFGIAIRLRHCYRIHSNFADSILVPNELQLVSLRCCVRNRRLISRIGTVNHGGQRYRARTKRAQRERQPCNHSSFLQSQRSCKHPAVLTLHEWVEPAHGSEGSDHVQHGSQVFDEAMISQKQAKGREVLRLVPSHKPKYIIQVSSVWLQVTDCHYT
jgi:hypothetical protein